MNPSTDEQRNKRLRISYSINLLLAVLLFVVLIVLGAGYASCRVQAHNALREAKDAELTMRMLAVYHLSDGESVYDFSQPSGIAPGMLEEIQEISGADGELRLFSWDTKEGVPTSLTYNKGRVVVTFTYDSDTASAAWAVDFRFPVLRFA